MNDFVERTNQYRMFLKSNMIAAADASGLTEISCKCKYCPDGRDPSHGHMYIHIPTSENDVSTFYCQKCHSSGLVTNRTLIEWGIYDPMIADYLMEINKRASRKSGGNQYQRNVYYISNAIKNIELANKKLAYINNRIGTSLTLDDCLREKIILNLYDVLEYNQINQYTRAMSIIYQLNDNFVGFLSEDNNFVNLRRICEMGKVYQTIDKRYINYNIFGKQDNTEKFYISPCTINIAIPRRIRIHIAEGPFDILSIKYNLRRDQPDIYAAIGGNTYKGFLMHFMNSMMVYYIELHVYPDNDQSGNNYVMNDLIQYIRPYMIPMYIHRNMELGEKDFGVPLNRIKEQIIKVN